jgi:putative salt-induced outer membrane protein YdiY
MYRPILRVLSFVLVAVAAASAAAAQTPPQAPAPPAAPEPPPPPWTGSVGLGFSMNRGNTSTTNFNVTFDAKSDVKKKGVWKFKGLYLRSSTDGELSADRLLLDSRYERTIAARVYGFASLGFLEDQFKAIDYLWAPAAGIGYKLVAAEKTTLSADAGLGMKIQKNTGVDANSDVAILMSDKFEHKLAKDSALTQGFGALWDAGDFGDALYTFSAGVAAALTARTQVKVDLLDAYVTRPPTADIKKNDVSLITSFVYKF